MQRIILSTALFLAALGFTSTAHAHRNSTGRVYAGNTLVRPTIYSTRSLQSGKVGPIRSGSRGWYTRSCWCPRYGCYGYYNPTCSCWYYWCPAQSCYYPFSYINQYPPTSATPQVVVQPAGPDGPPVGPGGPGGPPVDPGSPPPVPEVPQ